MKSYSAPQVKHVCLRIGNVPPLRQPGLQVEMLVAVNQRVEKEFVNALRVRVDTDSRVEVGWAALDDHHQRLVGWFLMRACRHEQAGRGQDDQIRSGPARLM